MTAAQRALLSGPDKKSDGKKTTTTKKPTPKKPAVLLPMDELRERRHREIEREKERKKAKENGTTAP